VSDENERLLREGQIRTMKHSDFAKCEHVILLPSHYRDDGTCKCDDPNEKQMKKWGYRWKDGRWR
jgi:hypothetical protein